MNGTRIYKLTGINHLPGEDNDEYYIDVDIRRRIHVVFVNETTFDSGDEIVIFTDSLVSDVIDEYKNINKVRIGKTK